MRLKIIAGNLAVVVLLGLAAYLFVGEPARSDLLGRARGQDRQRSRAVRALVPAVGARVRRSGRRARGRAPGARRVRRARRRQPPHARLRSGRSDRRPGSPIPARGERGGPDIVVIVDESRQGDRAQRRAQRDVRQAARCRRSRRWRRRCATALPRHDVWLEQQEKKLLQTAIAPIRSDTGTVLGALVVGYDLSNGVARREAQMLDRDIAFLVDGKVYSSSLDGGAVARSARRSCSARRPARPTACSAARSRVEPAVARHARRRGVHGRDRAPADGAVACRSRSRCSATAPSSSSWSSIVERDPDPDRARRGAGRRSTAS